MTDLVPTPEQMVERIISIGNARDKALISVLYLTGARVGEVVNRLNIADITTLEQDGHKVYLFKVFIEKKRQKTNPHRIIPIPYATHKGLIDAIMEYVTIAKIRTDATMFRISRQQAWNICQNWLGFNPHFLRHIRLTHLVQFYGFTDQKLVAWTGWKDSRPASIYTHLQWKDLYKSMMG